MSLSALFTSCVALEFEDPVDYDGTEVYPVEASAIANAVPKRRREYAAARICARRGLVRLGLPEAPILNAKDRSPLWPSGVVGSITHTDRLAASAVARRLHCRSLGVDVEPIAALDASIVAKVCTPKERKFVRTRDEYWLAKLIFSAKECFYKCQYPLSNTYLGFQDVELWIDIARNRYRVELQRSAGPFSAGQTFEGRFALQGDFLVSSMEWGEAFVAERVF
ncbi:MAG: 4'-phosphopantetheinyl transferase superfamily protein [Myxococcota bacterium]